MEVGSKALREVEFRQQLRGYHQDDVDKFLEEVAAGIEVLQDRLREANERASRLEMADRVDGDDTMAIERVSPAPSPPVEDVDEAVRRTLELAHRTMTLAIGEAKEEARQLVAEAEARAAEIVEAAEAAADRRMLAGRNELRDEVARLTAARAELAGQVAELEEKAEQGLLAARDSLLRALEALEPDPPARREHRESAPADAEAGRPASGPNPANPPAPSLGPDRAGSYEPIHNQHGRVRLGPGAQSGSADLAGQGPTPRGWAGSSATSPPGPSPSGSSPPGSSPPGSSTPGPPRGSAPQSSTWPVGWRSTSQSGDGSPGAEPATERDRDDPAATRLLRLGPPGSSHNRLYDVEQADS